MAKSRIAEAYVQVIPTTSGIASALDSEMTMLGTGAANKFSGGFKGSIGKIAGVVGGVLALDAIMDWGKKSVDSLARIETISAQTASALHATGAEAWTTSGHIDSLAASLENATATEAESIAEGANLLLTFKNIQNGVGEGNDVFDQTTKAMVDMARAMGTDASGGAIQLGKALNDPTNGISALTRVGVTFSDEQKTMIESLQASGDMMGAQKIILAELNSEFGGSGQAYAETYAGKVDLLNHSMGTLGESVFASVMPALEGLIDVAKPVFDFLAENPVIIQILAGVMGFLALAFIGVTVATWAMNTALLANPITWIVLAIVAAVALLIAIVVTIVTYWDEIVKWLSDVFGPAIQAIGDFFVWLWEDILKPIVDAIVAAFVWLWEMILKPIFDAFWLAIGILAALFVWLWEEMIMPALEAMGAMFTWLYEVIIKPVFDAIGAVFNWIYEYVIKPWIDNIMAGFKILGDIFKWLYENVIKPVFDAIGMAFNWIWLNVIKPVVDFITTAINTIGKVVTDVFTGIGKTISDIFNGIIGAVKAPINAVIDFMNGLIDGLNKIKIDIPDWVPEWGGKTIGFNIGKIPKLADGGVLSSSGSVMVGEAGPEILTLPKGARVDPLKNGAGTFIYNAAPGPSIDSEALLFQAMRRAKVVAGW
jgi:hypothetical protein